MVWISIAVLVAIFLAALRLPLNIGIMALVAALMVGMFGLGLTSKEVLASFPGDLFLTLLGITYLFGIARQNRSIDWLVDHVARLLGHRAWTLPPLVFVITAMLTALGAIGVAAVAIVAPMALRFARQYRLSPLMMGLLTVHGAQAGAFSPISIYGGIVNGLLARTGIAPQPNFLFLANIMFNIAIGLLIYLLLRRHGINLSLPEISATSETTAIAAEPRPDARLTGEQAWTLLGLAIMAIGALVFRMEIGFMALLVIVGLAIVAPESQNGALKLVDWSTILLIAGVMIYVGVLEKAGTITAASTAVASVGSAALASLLICYLAGVVSAFASSTALLGVLVPLVAPILKAGDLPTMAVISAICISTTIVDTSPFSSTGALLISNADEGERPAMFRGVARYSIAVVTLGPLAAWAAFMLLFG